MKALNYTKMVETAVAGSRNADGSVNVTAAAQKFLDQVGDHERVARLEAGLAQLEELQRKMANPTLPMTGVRASLGDARARLDWWGRQHAEVFAKETEQYDQAIGAFVMGVSLAAGGGPLNAAAIVELLGTLLSSLGMSPAQS